MQALTKWVLFYDKDISPIIISLLPYEAKTHLRLVSKSGRDAIDRTVTRVLGCVVPRASLAALGKAHWPNLQELQLELGGEMRQADVKALLQSNWPRLQSLTIAGSNEVVESSSVGLTDVQLADSKLPSYRDYYTENTAFFSEDARISLRNNQQRTVVSIYNMLYAFLMHSNWPLLKQLALSSIPTSGAVDALAVNVDLQLESISLSNCTLPSHELRDLIQSNFAAGLKALELADVTVMYEIASTTTFYDHKQTKIWGGIPVLAERGARLKSLEKLILINQFGQGNLFLT